MNEPKPHISRLPVINYPSFEPTSPELAISIPLFYSAKDTTFENFDKDRFQSIHCKGAIWAAMALLWNTDLAENGVPVFFHIEDTIWDVAMPVFQAFQVPPEFLRRVTVPSGDPLPYEMNKTNFGKKYIALLDEGMRSPETLLIYDSDAFILAENAPLPFYDKLTSPILKTRPAMTYIHYADLEYKWWVQVLNMASGRPGYMKGALNILEQEAYARLGFQRPLEENLQGSDPVRRLWCDNYMVTFPKDHPVRQYTIENIHSCYCSPYIHAVWSEYNEPFIELKEILGVAVYNWESDFINKKETGIDNQMKTGYDCMMHCRIDKGRSESRVDEYYDDFWKHLTTNLPIKGTSMNTNLQAPPEVRNDSPRAKLSNSGSDKEGGHKYGFIYDLIFSTLFAQKGAPLNILEIGVSKHRQGSFSVWQKMEYIDRAVGIDIKPYEHPLASNAKFYQMNAYESITLSKLLEEEGAIFDIIIDDGSHQKEDQRFFLDHYSVLLSDIGYLICEDVASLYLIQDQCNAGKAFCVDGWANRGLQMQSYLDNRFYEHDERLLIKPAPIYFDKIIENTHSRKTADIENQLTSFEESVLCQLNAIESKLSKESATSLPEIPQERESTTLLYGAIDYSLEDH